MPVRSAALGHAEEIRVTLSVRWCLAFAASLGFDEPAFMDDARPGGPVVPPCFCVAPEWLLAGGEGRIAALGVTADERRRAVHVLQDSVFHQPFRAGQDVLVTARIAEIRPTSAGTYVMTEVAMEDVGTGAPVTTSRTAVIFRGVGLDGEGDGGEGVDEADLPASPMLPTRRWTVRHDRTLPHIYSECARIWNPIHTERAVALAAGLPDIILHGTATWGLAMRQILGPDLAARSTQLRRFAGRFRAAVEPGEAITVEAGAEGQTGQCNFAVRTSSGQLAISHGLAVFGAPAV